MRLSTMSHAWLPAAILCAGMAAASTPVPCGGSFGEFTRAVEAEAVRRGADPAAARQFFSGVRQDPRTIRADRAQGIFSRPFLDFSQRLISQNRLRNGESMSREWDAVFDRIERDLGVSRGVLLAFWAFETDFGAVQGDFNTVNSLMTLGHDCRRPELFQPQILAALELYERGDLDPRTTTGAWAGEIGMVQMLPGDIIESGVDGDGDGHVYLKTSPPDALLSGATMLRSLGWRPGEPWLKEIDLPRNFDWAATGLETKRSVAEWEQAGVRARSGELEAKSLPASVVLPQGRNGPAFLAYPNFEVFFEWNRSFVYVMTAAYFATRLEGAPVYDAGNPDPGLDREQMFELQRRLAARGHDVGGVDGILGEMTRAAVRKEQARLGLPADAWPTPELLSRL